VGDTKVVGITNGFGGRCCVPFTPPTRGVMRSFGIGFLGIVAYFGIFGLQNSFCAS
jgi:hypothetical protein